MINRNPYTRTGFSLMIAGTLILLSSVFILRLTWLTAFGLATLIISFIILALGMAIPKLSPEVCSLLLETGTNNISSIIEELGIQGKAVYLPSSLAAGKAQAFIPLHSNPEMPRISEALPQRLIVRYGTDPDDIGLLVSTIGTVACALLESKPGPKPPELESALSSLLAGTLGVADKVRVSYDGKFVVEIHNPRLDNRVSWSDRCLGEPLSSIVAAVTAESLNKPVTIISEQRSRGKHRVVLEVSGEDL